MGITIFYILSIVYAVISGLGIFAKGLQGPYIYIFLAIIALYYLFYVLKRKAEFSDTIIAGIITNLFVQLTDGSNSSLYFLYFLTLSIIGYRENYKNYWIIGVGLLVIELVSSILKNRFLLIPFLSLGAVVIVLGIIKRKWLNREDNLKKSLLKYETRDQTFGPADFESSAIITSVKDIDRHPGIERPLLYLVKFIHNIFNAYTTAIFSYSSNSLVLVQGFSHSELFRHDAVVDLKSGIYRQILAERKSVLIKEFSQNPEELGFYKGVLKVASVMIAPVVIVDKVEGVFVVDRKDEPFTDQDKELFDEATNGIGLLLAMLRLYEKERYEAQYLSSIAELAKRLQRGLDLKTILSDTIRSFKNVLKCDDISIASIDELNNQGTVIEATYIKEGTKFTLDQCLVGLVSIHKNPILKDDLSQGDLVVLKKGERRFSGSFIGVPVKRNDEVMGVIWLEDHQKKKFNEDDIKALNILSSQLSLAWQRAILYERVKELSIRDGLTGLYNHRHFQEVLEQEVTKHKNRELVLILFDIDHFKKINDSYGHQAGDEVLKFLGRLIDQTGVCARYGGEEFAIILPGYSLKRGIEIAIRLKDHLKKSEIKFNQIKIKITISAGIAHYPKDARSRLELIEKADKALYIAKETGRDKIVIAQSVGTT